MTLEKDFEDFISLLNQFSVEYLVVGGYAMAFHGRPRYTGDLDIWIGISESNSEKMLLVLRDFGFASLPFQKQDFLKENIINQIGYPPLRIDILTSVDGIVEGLNINFVNLKHLIANKKASGRPQDKIDIKNLSKKN